MSGLVPYKDIGCFADTSQAQVQKPLPELLFDDSSNLDYENFDQYIEEVICLCANAAFQKQYTHFAIQSLSKCYSGPNVAKTYKKDGPSSSCIARGGAPTLGKYESCKSPDLVCVGKEKANYVYGLANGKCSFLDRNVFSKPQPSLLHVPFNFVLFCTSTKVVLYLGFLLMSNYSGQAVFLQSLAQSKEIL